MNMLALKMPNIRGLRKWCNFIEWACGYPVEVTTPEQRFVSFKWRGYRLAALKIWTGDLGGNEFGYSRACPGNRAGAQAA